MYTAFWCAYNDGLRYVLWYGHDYLFLFDREYIGKLETLKNILGHSAAPLKYLLLEAYHSLGIFQRFVLCFNDDVKTINLRLWIGLWKIFLDIWQLLWSIFFVRLTIIEKFSIDLSFASSMMSKRSITASVSIVGVTIYVAGGCSFSLDVKYNNQMREVHFRCRCC